MKSKAIGSIGIQLLVGKTLFFTKFYVMTRLPVPGVIGAEFLKKHTLYIDRQFKYLVLQKPRINISRNNNRENEDRENTNNMHKNTVHHYDNRQFMVAHGRNVEDEDLVKPYETTEEFPKEENIMKQYENNYDEIEICEPELDENEFENDYEGEIGHTYATVHRDGNLETYDDEEIMYEQNHYDTRQYEDTNNYEYENSENNVESMPKELDLDVDRDCDVVEYKQYKNMIGNERIKKLLEVINLKHLSNGAYNEMEHIIRKFNKLFFIEGDELTFTRAAIHEIETSTNIPINKRQYRMPEATKIHIDEQIEEMLNLGIIKPSKSPWNAPVLCIPKKNGIDGKKRYRIVVDFRALNTITKPFVFPIPLINEILDNIGDSQYFSTIDLKSGFYQIPIHPRDAAKTAFSTSKGHYEFTRMPMGLKNSPSTFQKLMNTVLYEIQPVKAFVYLDDIVIFGKTIAEHNENLVKVLEALSRHNLKVEPEKCSILQTQIKYLGHIIDKDGIKPTDENVKTIKDMKRPQTIRDVRSFLGTVNFYGKFIPNMADKRKHLNNLLKKDVKFKWTEDCEKAFVELKNCLISEPILVRPNYNDTFVITTDASDYAIGAVLSNEKTNDHPIAYASRALVGAERRYHTIEKELLGIVWAIEYFKHFIFNQRFIVYTDHRPLIAIWRLKETSPTLSKLRLRIQGIECDIRYKQGKENVVADFLSRMNKDETCIENQKSMLENSDGTKLVAVMTRQQKRNQLQQQNSNDNVSTKATVSPTSVMDVDVDFNRQQQVGEVKDDTNNQNEPIIVDTGRFSPFKDRQDLTWNHHIDGLEDIDFSRDEEYDRWEKISYKDFEDALIKGEIKFNLLKFSKQKVDREKFDATFVILNSRTAYKEISEFVELPHGLKDSLNGRIFSIPDHKIWGLILNGTKKSLSDTRVLLEGMVEGFSNCPDYVKSAKNILIHSFRNLQHDTEVNILRFIAEKFDKIFTLYANDKERMWVKPEERDTVLKEFHDAPLGGHVGGKRMLIRMSPLFTWENMRKDVENYVRQCESCQKNKIWPKNKIPMKITTTSSEPFQKIFMDIVVLTQTDDNNRYGLVIQDDLTRFLTVAPLVDQESSTVAKAFVESFICRYGSPLEVVTDQGANFMSSLMKNVCRILKIKKINTSAYHPQANLVERSNRELKIYLRQFIGGNPQTWDHLLPYFTFQYNTTVNSSTGYSPFELLYGRLARIPNSVYNITNEELSYDDYLAEMKKTFKSIRDRAVENVITSKHKRKEIYDKNAKEWQPWWGDLVIVETIPSGVGKKLQSLWRGPYEVVSLPSEQTTVIKNGNKLEKIHNNRLRKFYD